MTLVIGTDEAGYGPNLGPLVVAATAWRVAADADSAEASITSAVEVAAPGLWGDSKKIYRSGAGFDALERGALIATILARPGGITPSGWPLLTATLGDPTSTEPPESDILSGLSLPRHQHEPSCRDEAARIAEALRAASVRLEAVRVRIIQPAEFNALLASGLNKSDILSQVTLGLAVSLASRAAPDEPRLIWCDRHGGRRRYAPLVARAFDLSLVRPLEETPTRSVYGLPPAGSIEFTVGGESRVPIAVASMTAKYVRELAMLAFNTFWGERAPGLLPTAGYPVDAARWRRDAAAALDAAGIAPDTFWRRA